MWCKMQITKFKDTYHEAKIPLVCRSVQVQPEILMASMEGEAQQGMVPEPDEAHIGQTHILTDP